MTYTVKLNHFLSEGELAALRSDHLPSLLVLNGRYTETIDAINEFPITPLYVDCLRTSWLLDKQSDRPPAEVLIEGLGFAFGQLLVACTDLRWAIATDGDGDFVTMARTGEDPKLVSVPPFSYVSKRLDVQNAEVFLHFFEQTSMELIGFHRPKNWLRNGDA